MARTVYGEAEKRGGGGIHQGKRKSEDAGAVGAPMTARREGGPGRERKKTFHFQFESNHLLFFAENCQVQGEKNVG